jgi:hypothetical protein
LNRSQSHSCRTNCNSKKSSSGSKIKPHPPKEYGGEDNAQLFRQYVKESMDYLEDGQVARKHQIRILLYYIKGKAKNYYIQKVAKRELTMKLEKFFKGLFDFCFPIDFKSQLCKKLDCCYQNDRSINDYIFELEELHMILGVTSKRQRVLNLWKGFHPDITEALWVQKRNPDISSWKRIVRVALWLEVSKKSNTWKAPTSEKLSNSHTSNGSPGSGGHDRN